MCEHDIRENIYSSGYNKNAGSCICKCYRICWNVNISTTTSPMTIKRDGIMTYHKGFTHDKATSSSYHVVF